MLPIRYLFVFKLTLLMFSTNAQLSGLLEVGTGFQHEGWIKAELGIGGRYTLFNNSGAHLVGGVKLQGYLLSSRMKPIENAEDLLNFSLFSGLRYSIQLPRDNNFGFFPECRVYFSPLLPRRLKYYANQELSIVKGPRISQLAYGIGGGIFWGNLKDGYVALRFELSSIDMLESVRQLHYKPNPSVFNDTKGNQYIISITLCPPKGLVKKQKQKQL
jgi:hypothetical protein